MPKSKVEGCGITIECDSETEAAEIAEFLNGDD